MGTQGEPQVRLGSFFSTQKLQFDLLSDYKKKLALVRKWCDPTVCLHVTYYIPEWGDRGNLLTFGQEFGQCQKK